MNYMDDNTPRPEPVPGGGPAQSDGGSAQQGDDYSHEYGSAQSDNQPQYYTDRPGYGNGQYPPPGQPGGQSGAARNYQASSPSGSYGSGRYGPSMNGPHQNHQYGPAPQGGSYGPNGPYYQGAYEAPIPPEIRKWNWGAFMFNWIWGCGNGAYLSLLALIPIFQVIWWFVCGARGNIWAWKSGKFKDLDTFLAVQRTWNTAGLISFFVTLVLIVIEIVVIALGLLSLSSLSMLDQGGYTDFGDYNWS